MYLASLGLWIASALAYDGPRFEQKVVGWTSAEDRVLLRLYDDGSWAGQKERNETIWLRLLSVPSGALMKEWVILDPKDRNDAAIRGARWKAAEQELAAMGVRIDASLAPLPVQETAHDNAWCAGPWRFSDHLVQVELIPDNGEDEGRYRVYGLVVADQGKSIFVKELHARSMINNSGFFLSAHASPSGNTLMIEREMDVVGSTFVLQNHFVSSKEVRDALAR